MCESRNILRVEGGDFAFCEECLAGADSVILRICASCGHVGCAEGSPSDHAAEHYAETDHPIAAVVVGSEPGSIAPVVEFGVS
ncbi:MAG: UBP-type zinc finger domain-containing protein [Actinobacteria bacterium]|nr:UBP-type zinc finger domain-containing protein [Actinomycetota bacterium]